MALGWFLSLAGFSGLCGLDVSAESSAHQSVRSRFPSGGRNTGGIHLDPDGRHAPHNAVALSPDPLDRDRFRLRYVLQ